jgi:2-iminobutanoate/2-iminopropanoate deaminase
MIHRFNPASMASPFSPYSQGVEVPAAARTIYVAGQVGVRPDGIVPDGIEEQTAQAFLNIQMVLRARGMDLEDVVQTRIYMLSHDDLPGYRAGRTRVFRNPESEIRPATALLFVAGLVRPEWRIEIAAVAAKV